MQKVKNHNQDKVGNFLIWLGFLKLIREVLEGRGFLNVLTPFLVPSGAMESNLEAFKTQHIWGFSTRNYDLPTSPEFHLKKLLSYGLGDLFEIKTCFRNEEHSPHHRKEFLMLELYKVNIETSEFIDLIIQILTEVKAKSLELIVSDSKEGAQPKEFKVRKVSIQDLFMDLLVELKPETTLEEIQIEAKRLKVFFDPDDSFDDIYFRIWIEHIERNFKEDELTIVYNYPPSQSALAKINSQGWADRFEIYLGGFELGNAFNELTNSAELSRRWANENRKRRSLGKVPHEVDNDLIERLPHMPPCCGIAIGLERLFMAIFGFRDISELDPFDLKN